MYVSPIYPIMTLFPGEQSVRVITRDYNIFLQMPGPAILIFGSPIF